MTATAAAGATNEPRGHRRTAGQPDDDARPGDAIVLLMLDGGLRPGEVLCLQLDDIAYGRRRSRANAYCREREMTSSMAGCTSAVGMSCGALTWLKRPSPHRCVMSFAICS